MAQRQFFILNFGNPGIEADHNWKLYLVRNITMENGFFLFFFFQSAVKDFVRCALTVLFEVKMSFVRSFECTLFRLYSYPFAHKYPTNSEYIAAIESKIQNPCEQTDKNVIL